MYTKEEKAFLLKLARQSISYFLEKKEMLEINEDNVDNTLKQERATFVTLTINGNLRGCIGHLKAIKPLYLDVIQNSTSAAFEDPRFPQLTKKEFDEIKIEISVLSIPKKISYTNTTELLDKIKNKGTIIKKGFSSATYLPQVWEELPDKKEFISSLCFKAGLPSNEWENLSLEIETYDVEHFLEHN